MEKQLIFEKMAAILNDIEPVGKDHKNKMQNYDFRSVDDIYLMIHEFYAKHKVFQTIEVIDIKCSERMSKNNVKLYHVILTIKFKWYADDGSFVESISCGEAIDTTDKAINQAIIAAHKYVLLTTFLIPTSEKKDTENNHYESKPNGNQDTINLKEKDDNARKYLMEFLEIEYNIKKDDDKFNMINHAVKENLKARSKSISEWIIEITEDYKDRKKLKTFLNKLSDDNKEK